MSRRLVLLTITSVLGVSSVIAEWTSIGPYGGPISAGAGSPSRPRVMYFSPQAYPTAVLKTTDGGSSWTLNGSLGYYAFGMAVHPTNPDIVYAACGSLYRTTNGGSSWSYLSMPGGSYTRAVAINPLNPQTVFTTGYSSDGTYQRFGVHRSRDGGATWDTTCVDTMRYSMGYAIVIDPIDTSIVYCTGYSGQYTTVFKSTDAGRTWIRQYAGVNGYYGYSLHVSRLDPRIVLLGTYTGGIRRSTDAGETWVQVASFRNVKGFVALPASPATIYAVSDSFVYRSTDTGRTWVQCSGRPPGLNLGVLTVADSSGLGVIAATKFGVYRSSDGGASWQVLTDRIAYARIPVLAISRADPRVLYAEFKDNAVYRTTNAGIDWTRCSDFLSCGNICGFATSAVNPDVVWALEGSG